MKKGIYLFFAVVMSLALTACGESTEKKDTKADKVAEAPDYGSHKVEVYYFHGDRRCPACNNLESVAQQTVSEEFGDNDDVRFYIVNFERAHNRELAQKYSVTFSALLIVSGDDVIDLTLEGFQFATASPHLFRNEIIEVVNSFLEA